MFGKGAGFQATVGYVRGRIGDDATAAIIDGLDLPADQKDALRHPLAASWYPAGTLGAFCEGYALHLGGGSPARHAPEFEKMGHAIVDMHSGFIYRALFRLMSSHGAVSMMSRAWSTYFRGHEYELQWDRSRSEAVVRVRGAREFAYLGGIASGWMAIALHKTGSPDATVQERNLYEDGRKASDPLVFDLRW